MPASGIRSFRLAQLLGSPVRRCVLVNAGGLDFVDVQLAQVMVRPSHVMAAGRVRLKAGPGCQAADQIRHQAHSAMVLVGYRQACLDLFVRAAPVTRAYVNQWIGPAGIGADGKAAPSVCLVPVARHPGLRRLCSRR